ncbi:hypothetical protein BJP40_15235 [Streptomyces sp. CC53]|uniref:hypothetical protein n=1 Tax=unclassified Streptomyces TaxID=2593676 RepID=UPI0008DE2DB3|nr:MULTISPECIES: hypothetical protein [unclassified Streptomyces]OII65928.1 hypothetical protein BJP40_15235 [Streptomyces sp. CC53]OII70220.1 hypothetical protein BJP39_14340 [Streptomyces sp. CC77]
MNRLLKAGLTVSAVGAALGAAGGAAHAAPQLHDVDPAASVQALTGAVPHVAGPVKHLKINPLAETGVDPLDNGVGTQVADFQPVDTTSVTGSLTNVPSLPVAGPLLGGVVPG